MRNTYISMSEKWHSDNMIKDLRTSGMVLALKKIADAYKLMGV